MLMVDNEPDLTRWHYDPAEITVPAGTTVVWLNKGKEEHTVTADDKSFDSGLKKTGGTFSRAFPRPGKYSYFCQPHPWMKGTVQVVAGAPPTTAASAPAPTQESSDTDESSEEDTAAPASDDDGSGGNLAGTLAVVLLPTLGALALGAKLRQAKS